MYKPSLGLGTKLGAAANKSDLNSYLKNLKKKQKELNKKHADTAQGQTPSITTDEEDSDLASIARELKDEEGDSDDIFDSPFIKKPIHTRVRHMSDNTTPLPEKEFSFISSTSNKQEEEPDQSPEKTKKETKKASKALDQFVKFDQKYSNFKALKKIESSEVSDESEPLMSPIKITPSPKGSSRLRRQAEQAGLAMLTIPKKSAESTVSEISDYHPSPRSPRTPKSPNSPIFSLANLHDIEELIMDEMANEKTPDVKDNYFNFASPSKKIEAETTTAIADDNEVLVTEDDVDEELIEIELSEEKTLSEPQVIKQENDFKNKAQDSTKNEADQLDDKPLLFVPKLEFDEDQPTSDETNESVVHKVEKKPSHKDKKACEKSHKKRKSRRRVKSCYYCDHVCDYHMEKMKPTRSANCVKSESVQVGSPNVNYGRGHYMFDPSLDPMTDVPGSHNNDYLALIRSAWIGSDTSKNYVQKEAKKVLASHQSPMAYALSELLKGQLELTANFLSSQKSLYSTYCASLSKIVQKPANHDEHDKILYPREYKEALEVKEEPEGPKAEDYEYESEFESASSDDDTIVPTELSTE